MLTKADLKAIQVILKTEIRTEIKVELTTALEVLKQELKSDIDIVKQELKSDILTFKDQILGKLEKIEQDMTVSNGYGDQLEEHADKIERLEQIHPQGKHA